MRTSSAVGAPTVYSAARSLAAIELPLAETAATAVVAAKLSAFASRRRPLHCIETAGVLHVAPRSLTLARARARARARRRAQRSLSPTNRAGLSPSQRAPKPTDREFSSFFARRRRCRCCTFCLLPAHFHYRVVAAARRCPPPPAAVAAAAAATYRHRRCRRLQSASARRAVWPSISALLT